jgi:hypothetical protein
MASLGKEKALQTEEGLAPAISDMLRAMVPLFLHLYRQPEETLISLRIILDIGDRGWDPSSGGVEQLSPNPIRRNRMRSAGSLFPLASPPERGS